MNKARDLCFVPFEVHKERVSSSSWVSPYAAHTPRILGEPLLPHAVDAATVVVKYLKTLKTLLKSATLFKMYGGSIQIHLFTASYMKVLVTILLSISTV